jgi:FdhD protein/cysteine desulfurase
MVSVQIWRCDRAGARSLRQDEVVEERTISVYVGGHLATRLAASDGLAKEAAIGHAISHGWATPDQVAAVSVEGTSVFLQLAPDASGPGPIEVGILDCISGEPTVTTDAAPDGLTVSADHLLKLAEQLQRQASCWRATGGVHAALIAKEDATFACEDISRHTAMDKVIGYALDNSWNLSRCVVLETGRISAQAVAQAARARVPMLASRGATTAQAITLAEQLQITLVGFLRAGHMNIYSRPDRIVP